MFENTDDNPPVGKVGWHFWLLTFATVLGLVVLYSALSRQANAHEHINYSPEYNEWAKKQQVMPEAWSRFSCGSGGQCSCCDQSEIVKTKFRKQDGRWQYLHPLTQLWRTIPEDVIHEQEEETPTGEPVLFIWSGVERCFFIGRIDG